MYHIAYARLYIGLRLIAYDPTVSLHDDPETAVCIANGYLGQGKQLYLFKLDVPKIEVGLEIDFFSLCFLLSPASSLGARVAVRVYLVQLYNHVQLTTFLRFSGCV